MHREPLPGTPEPQHRWRLSSTIEIAADSWGEPGAPLVLLQHGGGQTRHAWQRSGEKLAAAGYHAVAVDARGHGDSTWDPDADYSTRAMVHDLVRLTEILGDTHPVLVGASMGGTTSLVAIGEADIDAAALVLVDVAPATEASGAARIHDFLYARPNGFASLEEVAAAIADFQRHREPRTDLRGLAKNVRRGSDGRLYWHWDPRIDFVAADRARRREHLEHCARRLTQPVLLVRGAMSDVLTEQGARAFLEVCPEAELADVPNAAHMIAGDRNDVFISVVVEFLVRRVPPQRPA